jgi:hypothetical protein
MSSTSHADSITVTYGGHEYAIDISNVHTLGQLVEALQSCHRQQAGGGELHEPSIKLLAPKAKPLQPSKALEMRLEDAGALRVSHASGCFLASSQNLPAY